MKVYIVIYENGMGGSVFKVCSTEEMAKKIVKKKNGTGIRLGTYSYSEHEIEEEE